MHAGEVPGEERGIARARGSLVSADDAPPVLQDGSRISTKGWDGKRRFAPAAVISAAGGGGTRALRSNAAVPCGPFLRRARPRTRARTLLGRSTNRRWSGPRWQMTAALHCREHVRSR